MMPKRRKPTHPGSVLWEEFLKPLGITPGKLAEHLGGDWNEKKVDALIKGQEHFNHKLAQACAALFNTTPEFWMRLQQHCNEWEALQKQNEKGSPKAWKQAQ